MQAPINDNSVADQHAAPTAGPFRVVRAPIGCVDLYGPDPEGIAVATFWGPGAGGPEPAEALANARKFTATPTLVQTSRATVSGLRVLLDHLRSVPDWLGHAEYWEPLIAITERMLYDNEAALAKAEPQP